VGKLTNGILQGIKEATEHVEGKTSDSGTWTLYFDGGSDGNPGPSAGAAILIGPDGTKMRASHALPSATSNQAEYTGLICGLELAKSMGVTNLVVRGDSKLVICQFNGEWKVKDAKLAILHAQARELASAFHSVDAAWIPRTENGEADREVRRAMGQEDGGPRSGMSFKELAGLKVGGRDAFSSMKREALLESFGDTAGETLAVIGATLTRGRPRIAQDLIEREREKLELTALRWVARNLRPEDAAEKVLIDRELALSARRR
jgi:ribonuclease HI